MCQSWKMDPMLLPIPVPCLLQPLGAGGTLGAPWGSMSGRVICAPRRLGGLGVLLQGRGTQFPPQAGPPTACLWEGDGQARGGQEKWGAC